MKAKLLNLLVGAGLGLLVGCEFVEPDAIQNLNQGKILVIGHGGSGFQSFFNPLPANSLSSINKAIDAMQADGVELDVQLTADKKLVLYHDEYLQTKTNCSGCITGQTAEEVLKCRYILNASSSLGQQEFLITLETVLARFATYAKKPLVFIDTKLLHACDPESLPSVPAFAEAIANLLSKYNAQGWTYVESSSVPLLLALKAKDSRLRLLFYTRTPAADIPVASRMGLTGITTFNHLITADQVKQAHAQNLFVSVLGAKSRNSLIKVIQKSPDAIQTDNVPLLINILQD